jgi:hypothetical protein
MLFTQAAKLEPRFCSGDYRPFFWPHQNSDFHVVLSAEAVKVKVKVESEDDNDKEEEEEESLDNDNDEEEEDEGQEEQVMQPVARVE